MIAKGNTHHNGAKLARYLTHGTAAERAELWQLTGYAAGDIRGAFRSVHVMAEATRCENPFFHVQVRNPDEDRHLTREEWRRVADRIETKLGLTNQPRAICFHIDEKTGHEHMHLAFSRIDSETMRAIPLPFFKERLKEVCRELEKTLDLTRVSSERDGPVRAPNRNEFEQARRLGVDIKTVRNSIRECWDRSDCGRSFEAALAEHGFVLAQGDRRAFVVVHEGGITALGKRILDATAGQVRDRLGDLARDQLPTVEQARELLREHQVGREKTKGEPVHDGYRDEMAWQDALAKAGIEKEKVERRLLAWEDIPKPPEHLRGFAREIWTGYHTSRNPNEFADRLERKAHFACVTKEEADRSCVEAGFARELGRSAPVYREGELVIVRDPGPLYNRDGEITERRRVYQLNQYTTGEDRASIEKFMARLDRSQLQGVEATKERLDLRVAGRAEYWESIRMENAQRKRGSGPTMGRDATAPAALGRAAQNTIGKTLDVITKTVESVLSPILTPEQKWAGARRQTERSADAADAINRFQSLAEREQARQREEREQEAARQRQRDTSRDR